MAFRAEGAEGRSARPLAMKVNPDPGSSAAGGSGTTGDDARDRREGERFADHEGGTGLFVMKELDMASVQHAMALNALVMALVMIDEGRVDDGGGGD